MGKIQCYRDIDHYGSIDSGAERTNASSRTVASYSRCVSCKEEFHDGENIPTMLLKNWRYMVQLFFALCLLSLLLFSSKTSDIVKLFALNASKADETMENAIIKDSLLIKNVLPTEQVALLRDHVSLFIKILTIIAAIIGFLHHNVFFDCTEI